MVKTNGVLHTSTPYPCSKAFGVSSEERILGEIGKSFSHPLYNYTTIPRKSFFGIRKKFGATDFHKWVTPLLLHAYLERVIIIYY